MFNRFRFNRQVRKHRRCCGVAARKIVKEGNLAYLYNRMNNAAYVEAGDRKCPASGNTRRVYLLMWALWHNRWKV